MGVNASVSGWWSRSSAVPWFGQHALRALDLSRCAALLVVSVALLALPAAAAAAGSPLSLTATSTSAIDGGNSLEGVACPTATQCTAVDDNGQELTFNPQSPGDPTPTLIDSDGDGYLAGVACPTATQCTAVDDDGQQVTFNPQDPGSPAPATIDGGNELDAVACPTASQCTAADDNGDEVTFNPQSGGAHSPTSIDAVSELSSVACPTASQCTAVDDEGEQVTFDPQRPTTASSSTLNVEDSLNGVACPSASQCTAVDDDGEQLTFNPQDPGSPTPATVDSLSGLEAIACPTATECVAVDTAGNGVEGDPASGASWTLAPIAGANVLTAVACPATGECVGVDQTGAETTWTATVSPDPVPANTAAPTIAGTPTQGQTLTASPGSWTNSPTSYSDQWEDCNTSGRDCSAIDGATGPQYKLTSSDVGHTIVVEETATNANGSSPPASSAATTVVQAISSPAGTGAGGSGGSGGSGAAGSPSKGSSATVDSVKRRGDDEDVSVSCAGAAGTSCSVAVTLSVIETVDRGRVVAVAARKSSSKTTRRSEVVGRGTVDLRGGQTKTINVSLNAGGKRLLAARHNLKVKLLATASGMTIFSSVLDFKLSQKHQLLARAARLEPVVSGAGSRGRRLQIGVDEVRSLEQQLFAGRLREGVGKAVSEVQLCRVATAFTEVAEGFPSDPRLVLGDGFDRDLRDAEQLIDAPARDWIVGAVDDGRGLDVARG